jgi:hypothetical protein
MMNQVATQTEIGKICSKPSPCSASRLLQLADSPAGALSHSQEVEQTKWLIVKGKCANGRNRYRDSPLRGLLR